MNKSYQPDNNTEDDDSDDEAPELIQVSTEAIAVAVGVAVDENPAPRFTRKNNGTKPIDNGNDDDKTDTRACPVTILSGFLGSGKTTLIQYILKNPDHGKKIAVIENEFGDGLAIESLIARDGIDPGSGSLQDLIELPNGCVCCTVKDTLVETLELLIAKRADLDYILIEASGMADPGPIASVFWLDEALESRLKLDGIVTLVDGKHLLGQLEATEEAARQIAYADRIVLNKVDLLLDKNKNNNNNNNTSRKSNGRQSDMALPTLAAVEGAVRAIHPTAPILKTSFSKIPNLDWILDADCFSGFEHLEDIQTGFDENDKAEAGETEADTDHHHDHHHDHGDDCSECDHEESADHHHDDHGHDHHNDGHDGHHDHHNDDHRNGDRHDKHKHHKKHHKHHEHTHTSSITSISLEYPGSVDVRKLNAWLADILWPDQDQTDTVLTAMLRKQEEERNAKAAALANVTATTPYTSSGGHASNTHNSNMQQQKQQQQIFRIKGIVSILSSEDYEMNNSDLGFDSEELDPRRFIVQAVHDLWDIQPVTSLDLYWDEDEARTGKVVVIGKFLQHQSLREGFRKCFLV